MTDKTVRKILVNPHTGKRQKLVFLRGWDAWFKWNPSTRQYETDADYNPLTADDVSAIDWNRQTQEMNRAWQIAFIRELSGNVLNEMEKKIHAGQVPENWDGHELRQWLADRFGDAVITGTLTGARKRDYNNTRLVNDL